MNGRRIAARRLGTLLASAVIAGASLAGCAAPSAELSPGASAAMQESVVLIAESAAAGDPAGALGRLDQLQQELASALADGSVSDERAAAIQAAIELVRADLQPAPVSEPVPEPETTTTTPVETGGVDDADPNENSGPGNNNGNGNNGNGNGNGNGKDKGKGGG